jgi:hypothetical protein
LYRCIPLDFYLLINEYADIARQGAFKALLEEQGSVSSRRKVKRHIALQVKDCIALLGG